jgi:hypothetical protein
MPSDIYLNNPDKVVGMKEYCEVQASDLNGHFVPTEKSNSENLTKTEDSIQEDFSL